jgi:hypothetical protein
VINRLNTYPMNKEDKNLEKNTINYILQQNQYKLNEVIKRRLENKKNEENLRHNKENTSEWIAFAYFGQETKEITKTFRDTNTKIAFTTTNTVQKHLQPRQYSNTYDNSGVYRLKCMDCPLQYTGQTGRSFHTRYNERIRAIKHNKGIHIRITYSKYGSHIRKHAEHHGNNPDSKERQVHE